ncbi:MAG: hypothetical protein EXR79_15440 [Myxococcales bacterium]|nr:hypothetical protein [Myxococcales bacterium]
MQAPFACRVGAALSAFSLAGWVALTGSTALGACSDPAASAAPAADAANLFAGADTAAAVEATSGAKPPPDASAAVSTSDAARGAGASAADAAPADLGLLPIDAAATTDSMPPSDVPAAADAAPVLDTSAAPDAAVPGDATAAPGDATAAPGDTTAAPGDTTAAPDAAPVLDTGATPDTAAETAPTTADTATVDAPAPDAATPPQQSIVRFAALGDTGKGNDTQYKVGAAMAQKCKATGCDFVLLLGDNFYSTGTKDENDEQFKSKFEEPYKDVAAPFFVVLGNHDYGGEGAGYELWKGDNYKKYAKKNAKFVHPDYAYDKVVGHAHLFGLDSNLMMYGLGAAQVAKFGPLIKNATETWKIAFAHHPYLSNGKHGNAGMYEGLPLIPIVSGDGVKKDYEAILCGKVDLLITGHDHSRQWIKASAKCPGVEFFVAGAGASTTEIKTKSLLFTPSPTWFEDAALGGFLWVELKGKHMKGEFWDENGKLSYTREYDKP